MLFSLVTSFRGGCLKCCRRESYEGRMPRDAQASLKVSVLHSPVLDCSDAFCGIRLVVGLHILIHVGEVIHQVSFGAAVGHGGKLKRRLVRMRIQQLQTGVWISDR